MSYSAIFSVQRHTAHICKVSSNYYPRIPRWLPPVADDGSTKGVRTIIPVVNRPGRSGSALYRADLVTGPRAQWSFHALRAHPQGMPNGCMRDVRFGSRLCENVRPIAWDCEASGLCGVAGRIFQISDFNGWCELKVRDLRFPAATWPDGSAN